MIKSQLMQLKTVGLTQYQVFLIELCMRVMSLEVTDSKLIAEAGVSALFQEIFDSLETFLQMDVKYVFKLHYLCFIMRARFHSVYPEYPRAALACAERARG